MQCTLSQIKSQAVCFCGCTCFLFSVHLRPIYLPSNTKTHPHTKPSISHDLTVFLSLLHGADNIPTATKEGTSKDNHDHGPHYLTVVPDAGKIPASTKEGTSKDNHGPKPNANAWAKPNLGTFLAHKGWK